MLHATKKAHDRYAVSKMTQNTSPEQGLDKERRLERSYCKNCFYARRLGGAAMTTRPCGCCKIDIIYGSTDTDALCATCAETNKLCAHCGGDIDMNVSRDQWPDAGQQNS